jgi:hypothetical protein
VYGLPSYIVQVAFIERKLWACLVLFAVSKVFLQLILFLSAVVPSNEETEERNSSKLQLEQGELKWFTTM